MNYQARLNKEKANSSLIMKSITITIIKQRTISATRVIFLRTYKSEHSLLSLSSNYPPISLTLTTLSSHNPSIHHTCGSNRLHHSTLGSTSITRTYLASHSHRTYITHSSLKISHPPCITITRLISTSHTLPENNYIVRRITRLNMAPKRWHHDLPAVTSSWREWG